MRVGTRIFSIVGGLGFVGDLFRVFEQWRLGGQGLRLLRRLRRPEEALGRLKSWWNLVGGLRGKGRQRGRVLFLLNKVGRRGGGSGGMLGLPVLA